MTKKHKTTVEPDSKNAMKAATAEVEGEQEPITDGWLSFIILTIFGVLCLLSWWMTMQNAIPGAPGAPIG